MIKILLFCIMLIMGCTTAGELVLNTAAGALGNMIDRRVEDKLGNDAGLSDEKLDGKISKKKNIILCKLINIESEDKYYECENSEDDKR
tara:strand:+ start:283 stop:549 length:267 start_codon:yes stop_codon:yes gene_type:complete